MTEGILQGRGGLCMSVVAGSFLGEERQVCDGLVRLICPRIMMGEAIIRLLQAVGVERFQGLTRHRMQGSPLGGDQTLIGYFLRQGMFENVHGLIGTAPLVEKLQPLKLLEPRLQGAWLLPEPAEER